MYARRLRQDLDEQSRQRGDRDRQAAFWTGRGWRCAHFAHPSNPTRPLRTAIMQGQEEDDEQAEGSDVETQQRARQRKVRLCPFLTIACV